MIGMVATLIMCPISVEHILSPSQRLHILFDFDLSSSLGADEGINMYDNGQTSNDNIDLWNPDVFMYMKLSQLLYQCSVISFKVSIKSCI